MIQKARTEQDRNQQINDSIPDPEKTKTQNTQESKSIPSKVGGED